MIAFIVRVHDAAEGMIGVVELPGSATAAFTSGQQLIEQMQEWLDESRLESADGRS